MKSNSLTNLLLAGVFVISSLGCKDKIVEQPKVQTKIQPSYVSGKIYYKSKFVQNQDRGIFAIKVKGDDSINYSFDVVIDKYDYSEGSPGSGGYDKGDLTPIYDFVDTGKRIIIPTDNPVNFDNLRFE
jgi:hypothetical protein